jgi:ClpX C4-type zinc finger
MFVGPSGQISPGCSFCGRDLWEVGRFVSAGRVAICSDCVELASASLRASAGDERREVFFPPRVFGEIPDPDAVESIGRAYSAVFGGEVVGAVRGDYLQDGEELDSLFDEALARNPGVTASCRVDRIRFLNRDAAEVRFQIGVNGGPGPILEGRAVRRDGRWHVTHDTALRVLALGGVHPRRR